MSNVLQRIRKRTLHRLRHLKLTANQPQERVDFKQIFIDYRTPIIAEIKFASPSQGGIYKGDLDHIAIARQYLENGAAALSVLTEPEYFKGNIQYIADIRSHFPQTPILLKDFVLSELQIQQAYSYGASAVLLIVAFLEPERLKVLYEYTVHLGLTPLIEIADQEELESIASLNPKLIIINNRNLKTQQVDLNTSRYLISHIDSGTIVICASGIEKGSDIKAMQKLGFQGFLIGTTLMKHHNPGHALKQLLLEANDER